MKNKPDDGEEAKSDEEKEGEEEDGASSDPPPPPNDPPEVSTVKKVESSCSASGKVGAGTNVSRSLLLPLRILLRRKDRPVKEKTLDSKPKMSFSWTKSSTPGSEDKEEPHLQPEAAPPPPQPQQDPPAPPGGGSGIRSSTL
ncbi:hypothetical protein INR49_007459 [Caranx melampygus]|nr:hypothetical protein INR49_007459 [Caranx melampygus]